MILEIADIFIHAGKQEGFEKDLVHGLDNVIAKSKGFVEYQINKGIESPERYTVLIYWEELNNHIIDFRQSSAFLEWRAIISPYLALSPVVEHFTVFKKQL